jgi:hypothetical protein
VPLQLSRPENTKLYESELATFWLDENGILCAEAKDTPRTLERQVATYTLIREIANNRKVCMLSEASSARIMDQETQDYIAREMPTLFNAMAVLSETATGKAPTTIFINLNRGEVPVRLFDNEEDAKEWLKQYL